MKRKISKLFKLRTNEDHYIEFQAGLDTFRFEFRWNDMEQKYALTIYKNWELKLNSYFLVWSVSDLLAPFNHISLGSLQCICEETYINEKGQRGFKEVTRENIRECIFRWDYEIL